MERDRSDDRGADPTVDAVSKSGPGMSQESSNGSDANGATRERVITPRSAARAAGPKRTEDERMLDRQLPVEPVPKAAELGAFTHTEAWRS